MEPNRMKKLLVVLCFLPIMASAQKVELLPKASISYCNEKMRITDENGMGRYTYSMPPVNVRTDWKCGISIYLCTMIQRYGAEHKVLKFSPEQAVFELAHLIIYVAR